MNRFAALAVLVLCCFQTGRQPATRVREAKGIYQSALRAYDLFNRGNVREALSVYQAAWAVAHRAGDRRTEATLLASAANCDLLLGHYRDALIHAQRSKQLALASGDCGQTAYAFGALSTLYLQLFNLPEAVNAAEAAVLRRSCIPHLINQSELDLHLGWLRSQQGRKAEAVALFERGVEEADRAGSSRGVILGLHRLGSEALADGDLPRAESALSQAYRLRLLKGDSELFISQLQLARLRLAQGDLPAARNLVETAICAPSKGRIPLYQPLHLRGTIRKAQGDLAGAVDDLRSAMDAAREWRGRALPADTFRTSVDAGLQQVYDSFISASVQLAALHNRPSLMVDAWQAAEFNRAASLRENLFESDDWRDKLDPDYWGVLAQLRLAEARSLSLPSATKGARINQLRLQLTEFETQAGLSLHTGERISESPPPGLSLRSLQKVLGSSRTLMSFHVGDHASYRWTVGAQRFRLTVLPPATELKPLIARFRTAVETGSPEAASLGQTLYATLFSDVEGTGSHWMLAISGPLFDVPFAALVTRSANHAPTYLIENRTLEIVPGAWAIGSTPPTFDGPFLGVGDPIYNRADSRLPPPLHPAKPFRLLRAGLSTSHAEAAELPRLAGSGREVVRCAHRWNRGHRLLTGSGATRGHLEIALRDQPSIVHIATHFLRSPLNDERVMIAFSLQSGTPQPLPELLTYPDVAALRLSRPLVVLSGCNSALGRTLPGAGLLGLGRAFLSAGATGVIASLWSTPDDSGELFASFYKHLRFMNTGQLSSPAQALRSAQLDMLHSSSWRSRSSYWAAYQLTGRSNEAP